MPASAAERRLLGALLPTLALVAAPARAIEVGQGDRARTALHRVGAPESGQAGTWSVAGDLAAGVTEGLTATDSAHERFAARVAAAVDAASWLNFGAQAGARYDLHPRDQYGRDDGFVLQPEVSSRLAWRRGAWGYGAEVTGWLPGGADVAQSLSGLSADGRLLLSAQTPALLVAGYAGYRLDRSARAAGDATRLRFGDRSALGASDYDALLAGLGLGYAIGRTVLFGEVTAQLLLGSSNLAASPLWVSVGARRRLGATGWSGEISLDVLGSSRPDLAPGAPLFPIEPRVSLNVGLRYRFGERAAATRPVTAPTTPAPARAAAPETLPTSIDLVLVDERGQPLQRARAVVKQAGTETPLIETRPGHYRLDSARPGPAHLRAEADGFRPIERDIDLSVGKDVHLDVRAEPGLPPGQVRGLVRSLRGKPLAATIRLEPGDARAQTDADGFFQIDVAPGDYDVVIEAPGYAAQRRKAKVEQQGVVIVNADLGQ